MANNSDWHDVPNGIQATCQVPECTHHAAKQKLLYSRPRLGYYLCDLHYNRLLSNRVLPTGEPMRSAQEGVA